MIDAHQFDQLYNISPTAGSCLGMKLTPEMKVKISASKMGRKHSPETRVKMSVAAKKRKRRTFTAQARVNMSVAQKARFGENGR